MATTPTCAWAAAFVRKGRVSSVYAGGTRVEALAVAATLVCTVCTDHDDQVWVGQFCHPGDALADLAKQGAVRYGSRGSRSH